MREGLLIFDSRIWKGEGEEIKGDVCVAPLAGRDRAVNTGGPTLSKSQQNSSVEDPLQIFSVMWAIWAQTYYSALPL